MEFIQEEIATLHDFGDATPSVSMEGVAVVVPLSAADVGREGVCHTFDVLSGLAPAEVIVPLRGAPETVRAVDSWLADGDIDGTLLWCNGPRMTRFLAASGVPAAGGKGLDVWLALGVAAAAHEAIVVHDADASSYAEAHVPRLAWPLGHGFDFAKGYYARIEEQRLYGRLVRLLWTPLIAALRRGRHDPFLEYLDAFRYPLAGEFAVSGSLATQLRLHPGWGLEVGMLGETYDLAGRRGTAQVDLGRHRHDHRPIEGENGLAAMATDIVSALVVALAEHDIHVDLPELATRYESVALEYLDQYAADAAFNGLAYDAHGEHAQVARYREAITDARTPGRLPRFGEAGLDPAELRAAGRPRSPAIGDRHEP